jgi:hypothetical protein
VLTNGKERQVREDGTVVVWAHYLGGRQGYPRRLNGVKVTISDAGFHVDGPYRTSFMIPWEEIYELAVEPNPDRDQPETTYVTRLVKQGKGSSVPMSKPATSFIQIITGANEQVSLAVAGISLEHLRADLSRWVDFEEPVNS